MIAVLPLLAVSAVGHERLPALAVPAEERVEGACVMGTEQVTADQNLPPLVDDGQFAERLVRRSGGARPAQAGNRSQDDADTEADLEAARARLKVGRRAGGRAISRPTSAAGWSRSARARRRGPEHNGAPENATAIADSRARRSSRTRRARSRGWPNGRSSACSTIGKPQVVRQNLLAGRVPANVARPFQVKSLDVAEPRQQDAAVWAKILPFVLFIWALTGAFYPAVDLCAGEKERGTLETLLSSPALRSEIVWGKLLTVMTFSIATATAEPDQPGRHGAIRGEPDAVARAGRVDGSRWAFRRWR